MVPVHSMPMIQYVIIQNNTNKKLNKIYHIAIDFLSPFTVLLTEGQNFLSALQSTLNNNTEMLNANKPNKLTKQTKNAKPGNHSISLSFDHF